MSVPASGPGVFRVASVGAPGAGSPVAASAVHYTVEVERRLGFEPGATARTITRTLTDPRGWQPLLGLKLERVEEDPDVRVLLATPGTTDRLCAPLATLGRVSCRNGDLVVLNALRWAQGVPHYGGRLAAYRRYLVNHELGHALGQAHVSCPGPGEPAPVMMQQTYGIGGCRLNVWPGKA